MRKHPSPFSETDLAGLRQRCPEAVERWFRDHADGVYTFVFYRVGKDHELAAEVAQDTFVTALDRIGDYDPGRGAMSTWLTYTARNCIRSALTRSKRHRAEAARWQAIDENLVAAYREMERSQPEQAMPLETKERILTALTGDGAPDSSQPSWRRRAPWWVTAAAAAVLMALIVLWPGGTRPALAWADVAEHFEQVHSMVAWVTSEETSPSGAVKVTHYRALQKDPGLSRTEIISGPGPFPPPRGTVAPERVESTLIMRSAREESTIVRLSHRDKSARHTTLSYAGSALEGREVIPRGLVAGTWNSLRGLAADRARIIGEREIEGVPVVGFEARADELPGGDEAPVDGVVRVWASAETAVPIEIELEFGDESWGSHRTVFESLEWNAPLNDDLFDTWDLEGWTVIAESIREVGFSMSVIADGVTLSVGLEGGPSVLTEADVAAVPFGREIRRSGEEPRRIITLLVTPSAESRLRTFTAAHIGDRVVFDLNDGDVRFGIRIGGTIGHKMQIDITPLGKTLEEFAEDYLTTRR